MIIGVTRQDIKVGVRWNAGRCPIALAIRRQAAIGDVVVAGHYAQFDGWTWNLPREVSDFMAAYDAGRQVFPFDFEL